MCVANPGTHTHSSTYRLFTDLPLRLRLHFPVLNGGFTVQMNALPIALGRSQLPTANRLLFPPFPNALLTRAITESVSSWPEGCVRPCPTTAVCEHPPCKVGLSHSLCSIILARNPH